MEDMKKVFICSPFRGAGSTEDEVHRNRMSNTSLAKRMCRYALGKDAIPYCPHLYFPRFLEDSDSKEREMGMLLGLTWLAHCDELWVIGRRISKGMEREIAKAKEWGIPVKYFDVERVSKKRTPAEPGTKDCPVEERPKKTCSAKVSSAKERPAGGRDQDNHTTDVQDTPEDRTQVENILKENFEAMRTLGQYLLNAVLDFGESYDNKT